MASINPALEDALRKLDEELEEGDITKKGYEKRRTLLLAQYLPQQQPPAQPFQQPQGSGPSQKVSLRVHSPDDTEHPTGNTKDHRAASYAALHGRSVSSASSQGLGGGLYTPASTATYASANIGSRSQYINDANQIISPQNVAQRFQEREMGPGFPRRSISAQSVDQRISTTASSSADNSRTQTLVSQNYAFNPEHDPQYKDAESRNSTMLDAAQGYFQDFAGQQREDPPEVYDGGLHRYSQSEIQSPIGQMAPPFLSPGELAGGAAIHQMPLEPREVPFAICDPHNSTVEMSQFENIPSILRYRAQNIGKQPAYWVLDQRGKEVGSITWEKLAGRAERVAHLIRDKSNLYVGDRVALIYSESEVIEFAVALMGCFIAGVVAVPINNLKNYTRLNIILTSTQAHLALTTEANLKNFQRDITAAKLSWPRGVEWWKTNEFEGTTRKKKGELPALVVPDLAYIEFCTAPTGDLRGVVMSHKTVMHQMATLSAVITSATSNTRADTFNPTLRDKQGHLMTTIRGGENILSYLDPRQGIGMILGVLLNVYGGHTVTWIDQSLIETPGLYAHLISKHRANLVVADYPGLKRAVLNYQAEPLATRNYKKNVEPSFHHIKLCLIDTLTVDADFHELLADRWLKPLRNPRAREVVAPMLCLPEHGGMVISMRDWLGGEERMGCPLVHEMDHDQNDGRDEKKEDDMSTKQSGFGSSLIGGTLSTSKKSREKNPSDLGEVLLDKEALKTNDAVVLAMGSEARAKASSFPNAVRCAAFGYPIPDATVAVVDPETGLLCSPNTVGEIWVDSPSLSGGFWALPRFTETIFHARPFAFKPGNPNPTPIDPEFLRTGLLGCIIAGKIYVLGLYEDRLRQRVEWVEHGVAVQEHRYFFVQHLILTLIRNMPKISDCSAFDCFVNDEHLPIILLESPAASTAPISSGGPPRQLDVTLLDSLAERAMELLYHEHHLRVYCVLVTAPGSLPRVVKNGRREIGNMLCRKDFDTGSLICVHVKFGVERAVQNLPIGEDIEGGIWSADASAARTELLFGQETQWSGVDHREVVIDDRTSTALSNFTSIFDLLQWRVARQADELAYCTVDGRGKEGKGLTWKKFDTRVAAVVTYLKNKVKVKASDHVILMYTHSEEYVFAIYACMVLGAIAIPVAPLDANRLSEDAPAFLHIVADMGVRTVLCNADVDQLLKQKLVSQHLKQSAQYLRTNIPEFYNTMKTHKQSHGCRESGFAMNRAWVSMDHPVIVWTYWTPDQRRISVQLGHDTLLGMCKVQKETCQMTSSKPVLACVRSTIGIGFIHTALMGVYNGCPTYLMSPLDFAQNPAALFLSLSRYKVKDTYATAQMLDFAMSHMIGKGFSLHELKNLMIYTESRPRLDIFNKVRGHYAQTGLERTAVSTIYSHVLNPMVASRSYMSIEPIELWLDIRALRRGLVYPADPDTDPTALLVQDSGMVPVSTRIAIVNPETCQLCHIGEYGEIWVQSEACAKSFYMSKQPFDEERFRGRIIGGDPDALYVRTGDLGFLQNVTKPIGPGNQNVEMQILFVLGSIGETFEVNGLNHFPIDIENSVEKCHRNIIPGGCAVFQAGGLVVVLLEVFRKAYLASLVPVIVNTVLNEHQIVVDIVAFVGQGDFPRSRLGEKQRGKILASWVTRKLRTIAQFSIRDPDGAESSITEVAESVQGAKSRTSQDFYRVSTASETPANGKPGGGKDELVSRRSSIMPDQPLTMSSNENAVDSGGLYKTATVRSATKLATLTSGPDAPDPRPGFDDRPAELPEHEHEGHELYDTPYDNDNRFYDPNADPENEFDDYQDDSGISRTRRMQLTIVNPEEYGSNTSNDNTPTSYTASTVVTAPISTATARTTNPLTQITSQETTIERSPIEDSINPYHDSIPASVPGFDFVGQPPPRSPARKFSGQDAFPNLYGQVTSPSAPAVPKDQSPYAARLSVDRQSASAPRPRQASDNSNYPIDDLPPEAWAYVSDYPEAIASPGSHRRSSSDVRNNSKPAGGAGGPVSGGYGGHKY